ncbi:MAG: hypothetical protein G8237_00040 [Magnetococcales bacterium]|nr:hypothetical protein [Magnetococcales bacterium]
MANIILSANYSAWVDTGIDVSTGETLDITSTGTWNLANGDSSYTCNANGLSWFTTRPGGFLVGTVLGKIGTSGESFLIGTHYTGRSSSPGRLYIVVNDTNHANNSGSMSVSVGVKGRNTLDDDVFEGSESSATVSNTFLTSAVTIDLNLTEEQNTRGGGLDTFINIDHLIGSDYADILIGNDNNNTLEGSGGDDILRGNAGNDTLRGGSENDTLYGNSGTDILYGGTENDTLYGGSEVDQLYGESEQDNLYGEAGNDTLNGGTGADMLNGGTGQDTMTGGSGADRFKYTKSNEGNDTITDFGVNDKLVFVSVNFGRLATGTLPSTAFRANSTGTANSNSQRFIFNTTSGVLKYDADGNGSAIGVPIATLTGVTRMSANQILITSS